MLAIILALEEWRWLQGLQTEEPFQLYSDHRSLEYFITTKKLSGRQARWAEYLSRFYFKLMYRTGKSNARADALSRKAEEVRSQQKAIEQYRTQVFLPTDKVDIRVLKDLELDRLISQPSDGLPGRAGETADIAIAELAVPELEPEWGYDSLQLIDSILRNNRTNSELQELRQKAQNEQGDDTWQLRDGLLLRSGKLFVTEDKIESTTGTTSLRTAIIREAYKQPLLGHLRKAKLKQLISSRYYWLGQGSDIDRYCANCYVCRRSHVPRDKKPGFLQQLLIPDRPWQHITVDFKSARKARQSTIWWRYSWTGKESGLLQY
jgi:hypothetical protein